MEIDEKLNDNPVDDVLEEEQEQEDNPEDYFTPIGRKKQSGEIRKIKPILPSWLTSESITFSDVPDQDVTIDELNIDPRLIENIKQIGVEKLFPVQRHVMPKIINDLRQRKYLSDRIRDVCVLSPTGSGKTLVYAVPVINHLLNRVVTEIRALIIVPVGELAVQVFRLFQSLCKQTTLRVGLATSASGHGEQQQIYRENGTHEPLCMVDILIATPGRLMDLIQNNERPFHLRYLQILIIDEADRMMNETQSPWLKAIEQAVYGGNSKFYCPCLAKSQSPPFASNRFNFDPICGCSVFERPNDSLFKMLFSATFTTDPEKIDAMHLYRPILFNVNATGTTDITAEPNHMIPENLKELMIITDADKKPLILWHLIKDRGYRHVLCFTNSIFNAQRLYGLMKYFPELSVSDFHSQQKQRRRQNLNKLKKFEQGEIDLLISTDITARGMDIQGVDCVVCYDLPRNETAYIHRIGRTARAGRPGTAITILSRDELKHFNIILRRSHGKNSEEMVEKLPIKPADLRHLIPAFSEALERLKNDVIQDKKQESLMKKRKLNKAGFKF